MKGTERLGEYPVESCVQIALMAQVDGMLGEKQVAGSN